MRRIFRFLAATLVFFIAFVFLMNTNLFTPQIQGTPSLLAHRGMAQRFDTNNLTNDTCTAERMLPTEHVFLENTIASMQASIDLGADVIELDIHPTTDGKFAVFHDWTLDCRTDGHGVTREHSMNELRRLDIGYGYTADGGKTFPFRDKGVGLMPTLSEVLSTFPTQTILINIKSNDPAEGEKLARFLSSVSLEQRAHLFVYSSGNDVIGELKRLQPDLRVMSKNALKNCLIQYILQGWSGLVPDSCKDTIMVVPVNIAPWLWGWPNRFLERMDAADTLVFVAGPYSGGGFSGGIDTVEDYARLPDGFTGGIWTNEIELIANEVAKNR